MLLDGTQQLTSSTKIDVANRIADYLKRSSSTRDAEPERFERLLRIAAIQLAVSPAHQSIPKNQKSGLVVGLEDPTHPGQPAVVPAGFGGGYRVKALLSGPGVHGPRQP
jgi:hypothetical protein